MKRQKLTDRQAEILGWVRRFMKEKGYAPTEAEIAQAFDLWVNGIRQQLWLIERKGYIKRVPNIARGLVLTV